MAMVEIDPAFIQAIEHRPKRTIIEAEQIPIVDLALVSSLDSLSNDNNNDDDTIISSAADVVADIGDACQKWGFFQVINHGVPPEKLEKIEMAVREFFSLPMEEKRKVRRDTANPLGYFEAEHTKNVRDWKEVFDCTFAHDPIVTPATLDDLQPKQLTNRWPQYPAELREACEAYGREVEKLALKLLELIGLSLGLAADRLKGFFFKEAEHTNTSFIRLNRYPPCPSPHLALGVGPHKDSGALTILFQDEVGGLQVRRKSDGEWISVKPTPGAYIVNVGDIIQVWSNDKYESVEHRVMLNSDKDRISIPFFFNPLHSVMVKPLEELVNEHNPANYEEYNWGKFFASRKVSNFKKLDVENIQVSHFRNSSK